MLASEYDIHTQLSMSKKKTGLESAGGPWVAMAVDNSLQQGMQYARTSYSRKNSMASTTKKVYKSRKQTISTTAGRSHRTKPLGVESGGSAASGRRLGHKALTKLPTNHLTNNVLLRHSCS